MEATDILSLNDDCLSHIVACISDPSSFHSFSRTCKRLQQLTNDPKNWHIDVVRSRAKYFVKCLVVHLGDRFDTPDLCYDAYDEFHKFKELVAEAIHYSSRLLAYDIMVHVWETSGPVASEVLKWIRSYSLSHVSEGEPRPTTRERSFTVHLPRRNQEMTVDVTYWHAYDENDNEQRVEVKYGDRKIELRDTSGMWLRPLKFWSNEKVKQFVESMKPVTDILQEELGETVPPIHTKFLYWFIYIFPGKMKWNEENPERMTWDKEEKIIFKDAAKNAQKPSIHSIQPMLKDFQKNNRKGFQTASARWIDKKGFQEETETCKFVIESLDALVQRADEQFLRNIKHYISRIFDIMTQDYVKHLPEKLMLTLIKRTSFATDKSPSVTAGEGGFRKWVDNSVSFKLAGNQVIQIEGIMEDDGILVPNHWDRLSLNFLLPDNTKINLDVENMINPTYGKLDVAFLRPVTKLLQECINKSMEKERSIPEIKDVFTAVYFISVVDYLGTCDSFLGTFQDVSDLLVVIGEKS